MFIEFLALGGTSFFFSFYINVISIVMFVYTVISHFQNTSRVPNN